MEIKIELTEKEIAERKKGKEILMNKPTIEKSQEQAEIIKMIALPIMMLDTEYCKEVSKELLQQANRQESLAVLNPNYPLVKNDIIRKQAKALSLLCQYIETLKEIEKSGTGSVW